MKKKLRIVEFSRLKDFLGQFPPGGFVGIYDPQSTLVVLDEEKRHSGSIYLKEEVNIPLNKKEIK